MKTKDQKSKEIQRGEELLKQSQALVFVDFSKVKTDDMKSLRQTLKKDGNPMLVIKKRLLNLILKKSGMEFDHKNMKTSMGTVFASNLEAAASAVYRFVKGLETAKKFEPAEGEKKILGGYDVAAKNPIDANRVLFIGKLPPREVLLAQLLGMIAAPVKSLLYILDQKAKRSQESNR